MSNGDTQNNCVMEVCCGGPGDVEKQIRALTKILVHHTDVPKGQCEAVAIYLTSAYDFAPKGSLYAFKQEIARLARTEAYHD
jgi:hypothetical protein